MTALWPYLSNFLFFLYIFFLPPVGICFLSTFPDALIFFHLIIFCRLWLFITCFTSCLILLFLSSSQFPYSLSWSCFLHPSLPPQLVLIETINNRECVVQVARAPQFSVPYSLISIPQHIKYGAISAHCCAAIFPYNLCILYEHSRACGAVEGVENPTPHIHVFHVSRISSESIEFGDWVYTWNRLGSARWMWLARNCGIICTGRLEKIILISGNRYCHTIIGMRTAVLQTVEPTGNPVCPSNVWAIPSPTSHTKRNETKLINPLKQYRKE